MTARGVRPQITRGRDAAQGPAGARQFRRCFSTQPFLRKQNGILDDCWADDFGGGFTRVICWRGSRRGGELEAAMGRRQPGLAVMGGCFTAASASASDRGLQGAPLARDI